MKYLLLILKNVGRNPLRSLFTALGTAVLVAVVALVWAVLSYLDAQTAERSQNLKAIVTERWQIPSQMPLSYATALAEGAARQPGDVRPEDSMTWQFFVGSIEADPRKRNISNFVFAIATDPAKISTMMDELDELPPDQMAELQATAVKLKQTRAGIVIGRDRLKAIQKRVNDRITVYGVLYKGIDLELDIIGTFPPGRYDNTAAINADYLNEAIDAFARKPPGRPHPLSERRVNLVWLRVKNTDDFRRVAGQIMDSPRFRNPAVKCETASSGIAAFLDAFRDLIWGMRWLLAPAAIASIALVIAIAISISVRERRTELAVLKVLGFRPYQILILVLGEATLMGTLFGFLGTLLTYALINFGFGGIKFPIGFFSSFYIPLDALWWGPLVGSLTALAGSLFPAWTARSVKVAEVFAKVA
jgi:putative ABC transport system permease protein